MGGLILWPENYFLRKCTGTYLSTYLGKLGRQHDAYAKRKCCSNLLEKIFEIYVQNIIICYQLPLVRWVYIFAYHHIMHFVAMCPIASWCNIYLYLLIDRYKTISAYYKYTTIQKKQNVMLDEGGKYITTKNTKNIYNTKATHNKVVHKPVTWHL